MPGVAGGRRANKPARGESANAHGIMKCELLNRIETESNESNGRQQVVSQHVSQSACVVKTMLEML